MSYLEGQSHKDDAALASMPCDELECTSQSAQLLAASEVGASDLPSRPPSGMNTPSVWASGVSGSEQLQSCMVTLVEQFQVSVGNQMRQQMEVFQQQLQAVSVEAQQAIQMQANTEKRLQELHVSLSRGGGRRSRPGVRERQQRRNGEGTCRVSGTVSNTMSQTETQDDGGSSLEEEAAIAPSCNSPRVDACLSLDAVCTQLGPQHYLSGSATDGNDRSDHPEENSVEAKDEFKAKNFSRTSLVPRSFRCPITQELMEDPVGTVDGHAYERHAIEAWFQRGNSTSPVTGRKLHSLELRPEAVLKRAIEEYLHEIDPLGAGSFPSHSAMAMPEPVVHGRAYDPDSGVAGGAADSGQLLSFSNSSEAGVSLRQILDMGADSSHAGPSAVPLRGRASDVWGTFAAQPEAHGPGRSSLEPIHEDLPVTLTWMDGGLDSESSAFSRCFFEQPENRPGVLLGNPGERRHLLQSESSSVWKDAMRFVISSASATELNVADAMGETALHKAAWHGQDFVVKLLLDNPRFEKANAMTTKTGRTALHYAAMRNKASVCCCLLQHASFDQDSAKDKSGRLALSYSDREFSDARDTIRRYSLPSRAQFGV